jgi:hypothetical protein
MGQRCQEGNNTNLKQKIKLKLKKDIKCQLIFKYEKYGQNMMT